MFLYFNELFNQFWGGENSKNKGVVVLKDQTESLLFNSPREKQVTEMMQNSPGNFISKIFENISNFINFNDDCISQSMVSNISTSKSEEEEVRFYSENISSLSLGPSGRKEICNGLTYEISRPLINEIYKKNLRVNLVKDSNGSNTQVIVEEIVITIFSLFEDFQDWTKEKLVNLLKEEKKIREDEYFNLVLFREDRKIEFLKSFSRFLLDFDDDYILYLLKDNFPWIEDDNVSLKVLVMDQAAEIPLALLRMHVDNYQREVLEIMEDFGQLVAGSVKGMAINNILDFENRSYDSNFQSEKNGYIPITKFYSKEYRSKISSIDGEEEISEAEKLSSFTPLNGIIYFKSHNITTTRRSFNIESNLNLFDLLYNPTPKEDKKTSKELPKVLILDLGRKKTKLSYPDSIQAVRFSLDKRHINMKYNLWGVIKEFQINGGESIYNYVQFMSKGNSRGSNFYSFEGPESSRILEVGQIGNEDVGFLVYHLEGEEEFCEDDDEEE